MINNSNLNGDIFCAIIFGKGCGAWEKVNNWAIAIPDGKPPVEPPISPAPGSPTARVLQITDVHLDLAYTMGTLGDDCGEIMCCHSNTPMANTTDSEAGYWGDDVCDLPLWTFTDMLEQIKETHTVIL